MYVPAMRLVKYWLGTVWGGTPRGFVEMATPEREVAAR